MTCAARPQEFRRNIIAYTPPAADTAPRRSLLSRLLDAVLSNRQREAQRAVEDYLARTGHRLTDSIEREMSERLFNGGWNSRR